MTAVTLVRRRRPRPRIGISACFFHPDPARKIFTGKTLQYIEQSVAHWVQAAGPLAVMIPSPDGDTRREAGESTPYDPPTLDDYAEWLDGLVLMGGADLWPGSYGETALQPQWEGDRIRDAYEIALTRAFVAAGKPVLGVCRGMQLLNVAFGGTLLQDIRTQRPESLAHRDADLYDLNRHAVDLVPGSRLAELYGGITRAIVNSVHHQGVKDLAPGFVVEARCPDDGMVEAIRRPGEGYVAGVQWHPEFHDWRDAGWLPGEPLLDDFLAACERR